jgi:hypothetical protein
MLLIIKDIIWEPTMLMKTNGLTFKTHDMYENKSFSLIPQDSKRAGLQSVSENSGMAPAGRGLPLPRG